MTNYKLHTIQSICLTCLLSCFGFSAYGQYDGGSGDGHVKTGVKQSTLAGGQLNDGPLFLGGDGDGADKSVFTGIVDGTTLRGLFTGGRGDGFNKSTFNGVIDGTSLISLYIGGIGDGNDKAAFNGVIDGTSLAVLFGGGTGDGFDKKKFSGIIDGTDLAIMFSGGSGDGADKDKVATLLDGTGLAMLYSGGIGDGFDKDPFNGVMDGTSLSVLYGGGDGDGFEKVQYQGVLSIPLFVELIVFDAYPEHKQVVVFWITANEIDNDYFTVQRTRNFQSVESIGTIPTQGNSQIEKDYNFLDTDPYLGTSYYRLQITGLNGAIEYSDWEAVQFLQANDIGAVTLYPNPTSREFANLRIEGFNPEWDIHVRISTMDGKVIFQQENLNLTGNQDEFKLELGQELPSGMYVVTIYGDYSKSLLLMKAD